MTPGRVFDAVFGTVLALAFLTFGVVGILLFWFATDKPTDWGALAAAVLITVASLYQCIQCARVALKGIP
jgi:hypothetical protein